MSNEQLVNKEITCKDCGKIFVFPVKDQLFYEEKGFSQPKRCKECRAIKKQAISQR